MLTEALAHTFSRDGLALTTVCPTPPHVEKERWRLAGAMPLHVAPPDADAVAAAALADHAAGRALCVPGVGPRALVGVSRLVPVPGGAGRRRAAARLPAPGAAGPARAPRRARRPARRWSPGAAPASGPPTPSTSRPRATTSSSSPATRSASRRSPTGYARRRCASTCSSPTSPTAAGRARVAERLAAPERPDRPAGEQRRVTPPPASSSTPTRPRCARTTRSTWPPSSS